MMTQAESKFELMKKRQAAIASMNVELDQARKVLATAKDTVADTEKRLLEMIGTHEEKGFELLRLLGVAPATWAR